MGYGHFVWIWYEEWMCTHNDVVDDDGLVMVKIGKVENKALSNFTVLKYCVNGPTKRYTYFNLLCF